MFRDLRRLCDPGTAASRIADPRPITNPQARTSLTAMHLTRPDSTGGWFHHFMHYYRLDEVLTMMRDAGLEPLATYGGSAGRITGEPFDEQLSGGMVIIAVKR